MEVKRKIYEENEDFRVDLELLNGALFAHVSVFNNKLSTFKKMRERWSELIRDAYFSGHEFIFSYTDNLKFANWLGENTKVTEVSNPNTGDDMTVIYYDLRF